MDYKEIIKTLKSKLIEAGFSRKGIFYCKVQNQQILSVEFYRKMDGFYNINLGILFTTDINQFSKKNIDIGWMFRTDTGNYFEEIMQWFEARSSIEQVKKLFWSGKLGDFVSDKYVSIIKEI